MDAGWKVLSRGERTKGDSNDSSCDDNEGGQRCQFRVKRQMMAERSSSSKTDLGSEAVPHW